MRLEKLNENQIRCILDREDLSTRGLRLSELAYGTEKARELFRDMMQQASYEFGFDAEDLPLMIEAIPTSLDRLVLIITKVEDPDELDSRFSRFSVDDSAEDYEEQEEYGMMEDLLEFLDHPDTYMTTSEQESPGSSSEEPAKVPPQAVVSVKEKPAQESLKVFAFAALDDISQVAARLIGHYYGENRIYKNPQTGTYYLAMHQSEHSPEEFRRFCNLVTEYASMERITYATLAWMEEHYEVIIRKDALSILASI